MIMYHSDPRVTASVQLLELPFDVYDLNPGDYIHIQSSNKRVGNSIDDVLRLHSITTDIDGGDELVTLLLQSSNNYGRESGISDLTVRVDNLEQSSKLLRNVLVKEVVVSDLSPSATIQREYIDFGVPIDSINGEIVELHSLSSNSWFPVGSDSMNIGRAVPTLSIGKTGETNPVAPNADVVAPSAKILSMTVANTGVLVAVELGESEGGTRPASERVAAKIVLTALAKENIL